MIEEDYEPLGDSHYSTNGWMNYGDSDGWMTMDYGSRFPTSNVPDTECHTWDCQVKCLDPNNLPKWLLIAK